MRRENKKRVGVLVGITASVMMLGMATAFSGEIANVNGKAITESDLVTALSGMNEGQRQSFLRDPSNRREILQSLIEQELVVQEGEKAKLDQEPEYQKALAQFRRQYLAARMMDRSLSSKMTEAGAKKWYSAHKSDYSTDRVMVQHILLSSEAEAKDMLVKAKAQGADFMELAEKYSKDPSAKNNRGEVGGVTKDSPFDQSFKDAAFRTQAGEIAGPVRTSFGYHLIKVTERSVGRVLDYSEVELRVKNDFRSALVRDWVGRLRTSSKVKIDDSALNKF